MKPPLAYPTMAVYIARHNNASKGPRLTARVHSYHFGLTSALRSAELIKFGRKGWGLRSMIWIAGTRRAVDPKKCRIR